MRSLLYPAHAHIPRLALFVAALLCTSVLVPRAAAYSPFGRQKVLVVFMEHPHPACSVPTEGPVCPRRSASQWSSILQTRLDAYYRDVSYGHTQIEVRVLPDPDTADGWWPTPHTDAEYRAGNLFTGDAALVKDAAESVVGSALRRGLITYDDLVGYTRLLVIDNFRQHQGQAAGAVPLFYWPTSLLPWAPTAAADAEGADDDQALSILEHELGHELGLPDLYSQKRCPFMEPGGFVNPASQGDNADCVGPWDHMALDYWGFPGLGAYSRVLLGYITDTPRQIRYLSPGSHADVDLSALEAPTGPPLLLRFSRARPASSGSGAAPLLAYRGYQAECRRQIGADARLPDQGVLVTYVDTARGGDYPENVARTSTRDTVATAILAPGETFRNAIEPLAIRYVGPTADGFGCRLSVNGGRLPVRPDVGGTATRAGLLRAAASALGERRSGSLFGVQGLGVNAKLVGRRTGDCPPWTACGRLRPVSRGAGNELSFAVANAGTGRARQVRADVRLSEPYRVEISCGPQRPAGRLMRRVRLSSLRAGHVEAGHLRFGARGVGSLGVEVRTTARGDAHRAGERMQAALGYQTLTAGKRAQAATTIAVTVSPACAGPVTVAAQPLVLAPGWRLVVGGDRTPLAPGTSRRLRLRLQSPPKTRGSVTVPVAITAGTESLARLGPVSPLYAGDEPEVVGGIDLVARVVRPRTKTPAFVVARPLTAAPPRFGYPKRAELQPDGG